MKKTFLLFMIVIFASCSSQNIKTFNTTNNSKTIVLETWHKTVTGELDNYKTIYKKDIISGKCMPATVNMSFYANPNLANLSDEISIKTDKKTYKIKLYNKKSRIESQQAGSVNGFGFYQSWRHLYCEFQLTPEISNDFIESGNISYFVSTDGSITELHVIDKQLLKLKEFLSINN